MFAVAQCGRGESNDDRCCLNTNCSRDAWVCRVWADVCRARCKTRRSSEVNNPNVGSSNILSSAGGRKALVITVETRTDECDKYSDPA